MIGGVQLFVAAGQMWNMKRPFKWVFGFVAVITAAGVAGFLMHMFNPGIWTGPAGLVAGLAVIIWLQERGYW